MVFEANRDDRTAACAMTMMVMIVVEGHRSQAEALGETSLLFCHSSIFPPDHSIDTIITLFVHLFSRLSASHQRVIAIEMAWERSLGQAKVCLASSTK